MARKQRTSNTHDPRESARRFNNNVSTAKAYYNRAGDLAREGDTVEALESLIYASHWIGAAQAELEYVEDFEIDNYDDYALMNREQSSWAEMFMDATKRSGNARGRRRR